MVKRNFSRVKTQCILSFVLKELCRFTAFTFRTSLLVISASLEYLCFHVSDQFSYQPQAIHGPVSCCLKPFLCSCSAWEKDFEEAHLDMPAQEEKNEEALQDTHEHTDRDGAVHC